MDNKEKLEIAIAAKKGVEALIESARAQGNWMIIAGMQKALETIQFDIDKLTKITV